MDISISTLIIFSKEMQFCALFCDVVIKELQKESLFFKKPWVLNLLHIELKLEMQVISFLVAAAVVVNNLDDAEMEVQFYSLH